MSDGGELDRENPRDFIERDIFARMEVGQMHHPSISINSKRITMSIKIKITLHERPW